jgi:hypothetical protein
MSIFKYFSILGLYLTSTWVIYFTLGYVLYTVSQVAGFIVGVALIIRWLSQNVAQTYAKEEILKQMEKK